MGKVLVEKLLRSCSGIENIYILLRPKKGKQVGQRLEEILNSELFSHLKEQQPYVIKKVIPIAGDITLPDLGINNSDRSTLIENVSVVFHSAATVRFDEPLREAANMNILGTKKVAELCKNMSNLVALVHVSTAYCNCDRKEIDEVIYPLPIDPEKFLEAVEWMDDQMLEALTLQVLKDQPNTYTFTKALAESYLVEQCHNLPVAIVRPSIVTATWKEPLVGWIDNYNGPTGMMIALGKGLLRAMMGDVTKVSDLIPVDVVINLMIAVAWEKANNRSLSVPVYNCTSGPINKITWAEWNTTVIDLLIQNPSCHVVRYPSGTFLTSQFSNKIWRILDHYIPAYLFDLVRLFTGRKRRISRLYTKLHRAVDCLEYFTMNEWTFHCDNVLKLFQRMDEKDKKMFNFSVKSLNWSTYFQDYVLGTRRFVLKEDECTLPTARKNIKRLYTYSRLAYVLVSIFIWLMLMYRMKRLRIFWIMLWSFFNCKSA